ncbi:COMM domain-containing protein 9 [Biomphalaria pfeifferi]|uniref:COMM domain-containing protein 9 n=1 Tax=Biomphalaria pfeifferi TaxID=112525 RepID=A0AAD8BV82_BIOPF|nr:COMM domain-containing protein 9 [Biomphalaria pfeifferi]
MKFNYSTLEILVKLSSKQQMLDLCDQAFLYRKRSPAHLPDSLVQSLSQTLLISLNDSRSCISTLSNLLKTAVFQGSTDPQVIVSLFPNGFHKNLRDLLTKIIIENMAKWKASAIANQGKFYF